MFCKDILEGSREGRQPPKVEPDTQGLFLPNSLFVGGTCASLKSTWSVQQSLDYFWRTEWRNRVGRGQLGGTGLCKRSRDSPLSWVAAHGKFLDWVAGDHNGSATIEVQTGQRQQTVQVLSEDRTSHLRER